MFLDDDVSHVCRAVTEVSDETDLTFQFFSDFSWSKSLARGKAASVTSEGYNLFLNGSDII